MYENMTILMKIEDELPERKDMSDNRNFKEEKKYIPNEWGSKLFLNTEAFVNAMMEGKDKFYSSMKPIFSVLRIFSYILLSITCIIAIIVIILALYP